MDNPISVIQALIQHIAEVSAGTFVPGLRDFARQVSQGEALLVLAQDLQHNGSQRHVVLDAATSALVATNGSSDADKLLNFRVQLVHFLLSRITLLDQVLKLSFSLL